MQGFGMGRYVPPELEGTTSGNRLHQRRAPGTLRKDGTQTVRFELPFAVWCHTCKPHVILGQGVRFNAEKKKVGYYHSTPVWQFRMRHAACGGVIEVRTDPKETRYIVTEGGKARDYGEEKDRVREGEDGVPILTPEERERRREDAFARLEDKVADKERTKEATERIQGLHSARERDWDDPWSANKRMRDTFRIERRARKKEEEADEKLKERLGTGIDLLPETERERRMARLVTFGAADVVSPLDAAGGKALFGSAAKDTSASKTTKPARPSRGSRKNALRKQLLSNTRAAMNPFGANAGGTSSAFAP